jgi:hypothetical protein
MSPSRGMVFFRVFDGEVEQAVSLLGRSLCTSVSSASVLNSSIVISRAKSRPWPRSAKGKAMLTRLRIVSEFDVHASRQGPECAQPDG